MRLLQGVRDGCDHMGIAYMVEKFSLEGNYFRRHTKKNHVNTRWKPPENQKKKRMEFCCDILNSAINSLEDVFFFFVQTLFKEIERRVCDQPTNS